MWHVPCVSTWRGCMPHVDGLRLKGVINGLRRIQCNNGKRVGVDVHANKLTKKTEVVCFGIWLGYNRAHAKLHGPRSAKPWRHLFWCRPNGRPPAWLWKKECPSHSSRALHFVPMGAHLVYIGHQCRPHGRPWAQNVGPCILRRSLSTKPMLHITSRVHNPIHMLTSLVNKRLIGIHSKVKPSRKHRH